MDWEQLKLRAALEERCKEVLHWTDGAEDKSDHSLPPIQSKNEAGIKQFKLRRHNWSLPTGLLKYVPVAWSLPDVIRTSFGKTPVPTNTIGSVPVLIGHRIYFVGGSILDPARNFLQCSVMHLFCLNLDTMQFENVPLEITYEDKRKFDTLKYHPCCVERHIAIGLRNGHSGNKLLILGGFSELYRATVDTVHLIDLYSHSAHRVHTTFSGDPVTARLRPRWSTMRWWAGWAFAENVGRSGTLYVWGGATGNAEMAWPAVTVEDAADILACLDVDTWTWRLVQTHGAVPESRYGHTITLSTLRGGETALVVFGGKHSSAVYYGDVYVLNLKTFIWSKPEITGDAPSERWGHSSTLIGRQIFVFGGSGYGYYNDVYVLDTETFAWTHWPTMFGVGAPQPRSGHAAVAIGSDIAFFGGGVRGGSYFDDLYFLELSSEKTLGGDFRKLLDIRNAYSAAMSGADVAFVFDNGARVIYAHRVICAARCPGFRELFSEQGRDGSQTEDVNIRTIPVMRWSLKSFLDFLTWVYTGEISLKPDSSTEELNSMAEVLEVPHFAELLNSPNELTLKSSLCRLADDMRSALTKAVDYYADVTLVVCSTNEAAKVRIAAHRAILSSRSDYFRAMLTGNFAEKEKREIVFADKQPESFRLLLEWLYTGSLPAASAEGDDATAQREGEHTVTPDLAIELLQLATEISLPTLKNECEVIIAQNIEVDTAVYAYELSVLYDADHLRSVTQAFIRQHYQEVASSEYYLTLDREKRAQVEADCLG